MSLQNTIRKEFTLVGIERLGGNLVELNFKPAMDDTGIIFQTQWGDIKARLEYALPSTNSILLRNESVSVLNVEHVLATLFAYEIDNVVIGVNRKPSRSFRLLKELGLATKVEVIPYFEECEKTLCDKLDEVGIKQQEKVRKVLKLDKPLYTDRLSFEPIEEGLVIVAITDYSIPGTQILELRVNPILYRDEVSRSRPYAKQVPVWMPQKLASIIASFVYPTYGIGHGFANSTLLMPVRTRDEWYRSQLYPKGDEITRHTILDRLGALALLDGKLEGVRVIAQYSGHANDIRVLKEMMRAGNFTQRR